MGPYMVPGEVLEVGFFVRAAFLLPSLYPSYHALARLPFKLPATRTKSVEGPSLIPGSPGFAVLPNWQRLLVQPCTQQYERSGE